MKRLVMSIFIAGFVAMVLSCGFPSAQQVKDDFKAANPTYHLITAEVGEGHGDAAYYHIRYKKLEDDRSYEQIWLYLRQEDGKIRLYNKEKETLVE